MTIPNMDEQTFGWLIGILEGEGCFSPAARSQPNKPRILLQMIDEDVVAHVASLWSTTYSARPQSQRDQERGWSPTYSTQLSGKRAVEWMETLRPHMSARRQAQIHAALATYNPHLREEGCRIGIDQAEEIRLLKGTGETAASIAKRMGISLSYVYKIWSGRLRKKEL
jgi:predicted DNA-binding protein (UPF0251 family)